MLHRGRIQAQRRMNVYLFKKFLEDNTVYAQCVKYWDNIVRSLIYAEDYKITEYIATTDGLGNSFHDGNPIYNFKINSLNKCVRIIQEEPEQSTRILFAAWLDTAESEDGTMLDELVISLELTPETTILAIDLMHAWILRDLTKHRMTAYIKTVSGLRKMIAEQVGIE